MATLRRLKDLPIRQKLRLIILLIGGLSVLGACATIVTYQWISSRKAQARQLEIVAEIVADQSSAALEFGQAPQAASILRSLKAEHQIVGAALYGQDGRLFSLYLRDAAETTALPPRALSDGRSFDGGDLLVFIPVRSGSERIGSFGLRSDLSNVTQRLLVDLAVVALVLLGAMAAVFYASGRLGDGILRPVVRLAEAVRAVSKDRNYLIRVENPGRDEIGDLSGGFNDMLAQIETRDAALALARQELEDRVRQRTGELEQANKELESFSYSVSHDLRAPLRAIGGFSKIIVEDYGDQVNPEVRRYLDIIESNTRKMGQLIDDLLAFSGLSRRQVDPVDIDLEAIATEVLQELVDANPSRRIETKVAALPHFIGDRAMFKQVLVNLLSNAVKYSRGRDPAIIEVGARVGPKEVVYFVKDNGVGFSMEYVNKLFGVFQRLHSTEQFEGTGVGLALVHRIIQRHGGRAWAEGALDRGATFYFALPIKASAPSPVSLRS